MVQLRYSSHAEAPRPRAWSVRLKLAINRLSTKLAKREVFAVSERQGWAPPPPWQARTEQSWRLLTAETNLGTAIAIFIFCACLTLVWGVSHHHALDDLWSELGGMTLDVLVILIVYEIFLHRRARREEIERHRETIDDFKRWDAEEGRLRIAGALRRLGRRGVSAIDFSGLRLSDFDFAKQGVRSLKGSSFYDGVWGDPHHDSRVALTRVSFSHTNCAQVRFSPFDPFEALDTAGWASNMTRWAVLTDCSFDDTPLNGAVFNGAELAWTEPPPADHYTYDEGEDGQPFSMRESYGPFYRADLSRTQFRGCRFRNADFRDAENLATADFFRAQGLEEAIFDTEADRQIALASAARAE